MARSTAIDNLPSPLWIALPLLLLPLGLYARSVYNARKLKKYGIGRGAPGFQTNVKKVAVTPELAARIRRGEQVSPEEIAAAAAATSDRSDAALKANKIASPSVFEAPPAASTRSRTPKPSLKPTTTAAAVNEWLPESLQQTQTPSKRRVSSRKKA